MKSGLRDGCELNISNEGGGMRKYLKDGGDEDGVGVGKNEKGDVDVLAGLQIL